MNTLTAKQTKDKLSYTLDLTSGTATMHIQCFNSMKGNLSLVDEMLNRLRVEGIDRVQILFQSRGTRTIKIEVKDPKQIEEERLAKKEEERIAREKEEKENDSSSDKASDEEEKEDEDEKTVDPPVKENKKQKKFKEIKVYNNVCYKHSEFNLREESVNKYFDRTISSPIDNFMHFYKANLPYVLKNHLMDFVELRNDADEDGFTEVRNLKKERRNLSQDLRHKMDSITAKARLKLKQSYKKFSDKENKDDSLEDLVEDSDNDSTLCNDDDDDVSDVDEKDTQEIEHQSTPLVASV